MFLETCRKSERKFIRVKDENIKQKAYYRPGLSWGNKGISVFGLNKRMVKREHKWCTAKCMSRMVVWI